MPFFIKEGSHQLFLEYKGKEEPSKSDLGYPGYVINIQDMEVGELFVNFEEFMVEKNGI